MKTIFYVLLAIFTFGIMFASCSNSQAVKDDMPDAWKKAGMTRQQWEENKKYKQELFKASEEIQNNARSVR